MLVKTSSGFEIDLAKDRLNNMELLDAIVDFEDNPMNLSVAVRLLLQNDKKRLYDHVRLEDGTVPLDKVSKEIEEIIRGLGTEGKN